VPSKELSTKMGAGVGAEVSGGAGWGLPDMAKTAVQAAKPRVMVSARNIMPQV